MWDDQQLAPEALKKRVAQREQVRRSPRPLPACH
jgi:hypothetical protein